MPCLGQPILLREHRSDGCGWPALQASEVGDGGLRGSHPPGERGKLAAIRPRPTNIGAKGESSSTASFIPLSYK